jgi:glycosyltransferase involved in cell wall biosynthesis
MRKPDSNNNEGIALYYFSNERIPGTSASALQQVQMCAAFAQAGAAVTLVRPYYVGLADAVELRRFYGVQDRFRIVTLPTLLSVSPQQRSSAWHLPLVGGATMQMMAGLFAVRTFRTGNPRPSVVYCRNVNAAAVILWLRKTLFKKANVRVFYEAHSLFQQPKKYFHHVLRNADGLITITESLRSDLIKISGVRPERLFVAPDAALPLTEDAAVSRLQARRELGLADDLNTIVVYTGSFKTGKGVEILERAAGYLPDDVHIYFIGGERGQVQTLRSTSRTQSGAACHWLGHVEPQRVRLFQRAADICVLPNTAEGAWHAYTSPLKMFEYMTAAKPIVASDLAVLREILAHERNALLVPAGRPDALANAINRIRLDPALAQRLAQQAAVDAAAHTWESRAIRIIQFIMRSS